MIMNREQLLKCVEDIIYLDSEFDKYIDADDQQSAFRIMHELSLTKKDIMNDWYARFNNNKKLADFTLSKLQELYFCAKDEDDDYDDFHELNKYIKNKSNDNDENYELEVMYRLICTLNWIC